MLTFVMKYVERIVRYDKITSMSEILRRYFVMNAFDGALTTFGVLIGAFVGGIKDPSLVIKVGLATSVAVGVSGFTGAFFTESAERKRELKQIEVAVHRKLDKTELHRAYSFASFATALVDGLSPFTASLFILSPFLFSFGGLTIESLYYYSFGFAIISFFLLGAFLGKVSKENIILTGLKLVLAGVVCMGIIMLIE
ncbi:hypothetical protein J4450_06950 [Candidatus Micrarchaeota archaeon]|nr:hypothetical protein [Candidatus Micrarchaeota archaeon]